VTQILIKSWVARRLLSVTPISSYVTSQRIVTFACSDAPNCMKIYEELMRHWLSLSSRPALRAYNLAILCTWTQCVWRFTYTWRRTPFVTHFYLPKTLNMEAASRWYLATKLHGVTSQKAVTFSVNISLLYSLSFIQMGVPCTKSGFLSIIEARRVSYRVFGGETWRKETTWKTQV
jgi:hypothetical protein